PHHFQPVAGARSDPRLAGAPLQLPLLLVAQRYSIQGSLPPIPPFCLSLPRTCLVADPLNENVGRLLEVLESEDMRLARGIVAARPFVRIVAGLGIDLWLLDHFANGWFFPLFLFRKEVVGCSQADAVHVALVEEVVLCDCVPSRLQLRLAGILVSRSDARGQGLARQSSRKCPSVHEV